MDSVDRTIWQDREVYVCVTRFHSESSSVDGKRIFFVFQRSIACIVEFRAYLIHSDASKRWVAILFFFYSFKLYIVYAQTCKSKNIVIKKNWKFWYIKHKHNMDKITQSHFSYLILNILLYKNNDRFSTKRKYIVPREGCDTFRLCYI